MQFSMQQCNADAQVARHRAVSLGLVSCELRFDDLIFLYTFPPPSPLSPLPSIRFHGIISVSVSSVHFRLLTWGSSSSSWRGGFPLFSFSFFFFCFLFLFLFSFVSLDFLFFAKRQSIIGCYRIDLLDRAASFLAEEPPLFLGGDWQSGKRCHWYSLVVYDGSYSS